MLLPTILSPVSSQLLGFLYSLSPWALSTWHWSWLLCLLLHTCVSSSRRIAPFCNHWTISALITIDLSTTYTPLLKHFPSVSVLFSWLLSSASFHAHLFPAPWGDFGILGPCSLALRNQSLLLQWLADLPVCLNSALMSAQDSHYLPCLTSFLETPLTTSKPLKLKPSTQSVVRCSILLFLFFPLFY